MIQESTSVIEPQQDTHDINHIDPQIASRVASLMTEGSCDIYRDVIHSVEKDLLLTVLHHFKGNRVKASRALGISRFTLRKKLQSFVDPQKADMQVSQVAEL